MTAIQPPSLVPETDPVAGPALATEVTRAQAVEAGKAPLASPTFTGTVTVPAAVNPTDAARKSAVDVAASSAAAAQATASAAQPSASAFRVVAHGFDGATARPSGVGAVYWVGTATPANATTADLWVNA